MFMIHECITCILTVTFVREMFYSCATVLMISTMLRSTLA